MKSIKLFGDSNSKMWIWSCFTESGTHVISASSIESTEEKEILSMRYLFPRLNELQVKCENYCLCNFVAPDILNRLKILKFSGWDGDNLCLKIDFWRNFVQCIGNDKLDRIQELSFNNCFIDEKDMDFVIDKVTPIISHLCARILKKLEITHNIGSKKRFDNYALGIVSYHLIKDLIQCVTKKDDSNDGLILFDCCTTISKIKSECGIKWGRLKLTRLNKMVFERLKYIKVDLMTNHDYDKNWKNINSSISSVFELVGNNIKQLECCIDKDESAICTVKDFLNVISTHCDISTNQSKIRSDNNTKHPQENKTSINRFKCENIKNCANKTKNIGDLENIDPSQDKSDEKQLEEDTASWSSKFSFGQILNDSGSDVIPIANSSNSFTFSWPSIDSNCNKSKKENKIDNKNNINGWAENTRYVGHRWFEPDNSNNNSDNNNMSCVWQTDILTTRYKRKSTIKRLILNGCDKIKLLFVFLLFDQIEFENQCLEYIKIDKIEPIWESNTSTGVYLTQIETVQDFWSKALKFLKDNNFPCCDITLAWAISHIQTKDCINRLSQLIYQLYNDFKQETKHIYNYNCNVNCEEKNENEDKYITFRFGVMIGIDTSVSQYKNVYFSKGNCNWMQQVSKKIETIGRETMPKVLKNTFRNSNDLIVNVNPNTKRVKLPNGHVDVHCIAHALKFKVQLKIDVKRV